MGLEEELKRIDEGVKKEIEAKRDERREEEERKEQIKEDKERQEEYEKIKAILESDEEGIDEPKIYYVKEMVADFPNPRAFSHEYHKIMTERERRLVLANPNFEMSSVKSIDPTDLSIEDLSEEEKAKYDAAKAKVELIKSSDEGEKKGIMKFKGSFFKHEIETSLKYALLSSMNIHNNGKFKTYEQIEEEKQAEEARKGKISFSSIKKSIQRVFGKER